eukprot:9490792-Pyramimonas_sp.AAC.1
MRASLGCAGGFTGAILGRLGGLEGRTLNAAETLPVADNIKKWRNEFLVADDRPELGCWLKSSAVNGTWAAGCVICKLAKAQTDYADFNVRSVLDRRKLQKHHVSRSHLSSVAKVVGGDVPRANAPSTLQFKKVLADRLALQSYAKGSEGVGAGKKVKRLTWCLSEALMDQEREFLRKSVSISWHQDAKAPRLLCQYGAATKDCEHRKGVIGIAQDFGTTSYDIKNAV